MTTYCCPQCGQSEKFIAENYTEKRNVVINGADSIIDKLEAIEGSFPDVRRLQCPVCQYKNIDTKFESDEATRVDRSIEWSDTIEKVCRFLEENEQYGDDWSDVKDSLKDLQLELMKNPPRVYADIILQTIDMRGDAIFHSEYDLDVTAAYEYNVTEYGKTPEELEITLPDDLDKMTDEDRDDVFHTAVYLGLTPEWNNPFECYVDESSYYEYRKWKLAQLKAKGVI